MNILVYSGEGTSRTSLAHTVRSLRSLVGQHYDVMKIDSKGLATEPWEESTALLVIPGGRDIPYTRDLHGPVIEKIQEYVRAGGKFWGICAGAYFASDRIVFEVGTPLEVQGNRELKFFGGECRGVVYPGFVYDSEQGAIAVEVRVNKEALGAGTEAAAAKDGLAERTRVYFNGGGFFVDAERYPGTEVLAWYDDDSNEGGDSTRKAAMVACQVGQGLALLTGVHPEYDAAHLDAANPEYGPLPNVVSRLLEKDRERVSLLRSLIMKLGIKLTHPNISTTAPQTAPVEDDAVNPELPPGAIQGIPDVTPLYLASLHPSYTAELTRSLRSLVTAEGLIKEPNDTFQLIASPQQSVPVHTSTLSETAEGESEEKIIKNLVLCPDDVPSPTQTPHFAMGDFFRHLQHIRPPSKDLHFGNWLMYGQVVSSTQTMLDKNFAFCQHLPNGFVCNATTQVAGRGRGRNSWISPPGCLQFSMVLRHPVQARHASAVFVQYLVALAVVESVCSLPGYEDVPLRLKWPNDIYADAPLEGGQEQAGPKMVKIGGVLVNSNFSGSEFLLVIGCGVNTTNPNPTTSINHIIRYHNKVTGKNLGLFTQETLLAHILVKLEEMYGLFLHGNGTGFAQLEHTYYRRWLHSNAFVTLTTMTPHRKVRIQGITLDYGLLRTVAVDEQGRDVEGEEYRLQPDGNSFDMLKGLISTKA
ncbi:biotin-protein ligase [Gamsiella multidivaricata]|uniref:biotin-protein ligase n=1 Tax=Gamsiella multidivaricata TaxID=101098 RepID=UPI00221FDAFD|nr:biotin-protein ligase [Gamsiella multidivaricata]KAG0364208.1 biotin holocarboxylase synthetase [Gamsiella multidivaricata]KAI7832344.1 biotin-protein ligase [Gamsiella multidivaricata]